MKFKNIIAVAFATLAFASCSDNDKTYTINTASGVSVEMGEAEITVVENQGLFNVPVVVTGDPNGYIEITVQVVDGEWNDENETEPALDDVHYYITTKTLRIAPDTKIANIEVNTQDDEDENYTRVFYMNIASAKGATIANNDYTQVNIKNKSLFNKMGGAWIATAIDIDGKPVKYTCTMDATDKREETCYLNGFYMTGISIPFHFTYDKDNDKIYLDVIYGQPAGEDFNFGSFVGQCGAAGLNGETTGYLVGEVAEDLSEVNYPENDGFSLGAFDGSIYMGYLDKLTNLHLARPSK